MIISLIWCITNINSSKGGYITLKLISTLSQSFSLHQVYFCDEYLAAKHSASYLTLVLYISYFAALCSQCLPLACFWTLVWWSGRKGGVVSPKRIEKFNMNLWRERILDCSATYLGMNFVEIFCLFQTIRLDSYWSGRFSRWKKRKVDWYIHKNSWSNLSIKWLREDGEIVCKKKQT